MAEGNWLVTSEFHTTQLIDPVHDQRNGIIH